MMLPSTRHRGQKACLMLPHGFALSVPNSVLPFLPTTKPGAALVHFTSTIEVLLLFDLMW